MKDDYPITLLCEVLGISRSGYHAWHGGHRDRRATRDRYLGKCIDQAFDQSRRTYGYPG
jgi:putative transposase